MFYYEKENKLYSSLVTVADEEFTQITAEEYRERLLNAVSSRVKGKFLTEGNFAEI